jgi:hypothetical protein
MGRPVGSGTGGRPSLVRKTTSLAFPQEYWDWMLGREEPQAELLRESISLLMSIPEDDWQWLEEQEESQDELLRLAIALLKQQRKGKAKKSVKAS